MEPLVTNHTNLTRELFQEGTEAVTAARYRAAAKKSMILLLAVWIVMVAFTLWMGMTLDIAILEAALLIFLVFWLFYLVPRRQMKRSFKVMATKNGGNLARTIDFYADHLELHAGSGDSTVYYRDILELRATDHLLILLRSKNSGILVERAGFLQTEEEKVRALIENHQQESLDAQ